MALEVIIITVVAETQVANTVFRIRARFANKARNAARTCSVAACESLAGSCCLGNEAMWPDIPANLAIHPGRLGGFYATEAESSLFRL